MSTTNVVHDDAAENNVERMPDVRRWPIVCATVCVLLLIIGGFWASHYQPIVFAGGWGADHTNLGSGGSVTQEISLRNSGPIGVTVETITSGQNYGLSSLAHFATPTLCPPFTPHFGDCHQNRKTGLLEGLTFHPFSLTSNSRRGVLVRFEYLCTTASDPGPSLTLPVKYRFLWFTHTILVTVPADDSSNCK